VAVDKADDHELFVRFEVVYDPTLIWTDADGTELMRTTQSEDTDEILEDQALALELLDADD